MAFELPDAVSIPLGQLRDRLGELDKNKEYITFCAIGVRSYAAARILMQNGFKKVKVYPAGTRFYRSMHYREYPENDAAADISNMPQGGSSMSSELNSGNAQISAAADADVSMRLDCSGMQCPGPLLKVYESMQNLSDGQILEVRASDVYDIADESKNDILMIQGIIDMYFENEEGIVLVDYKTDKADSELELIKKYKKQLDYYEEALAKLTNEKIVKKYIYSFSLKKAIEI